jgi:hypothetical protein
MEKVEILKGGQVKLVTPRDARILVALKKATYVVKDETPEPTPEADKPKRAYTRKDIRAE